ncbi:VWA domain-containing protein [Bacillus sp. FJAT-50079]|uniref:vWA domain-containing protein n=1 Tax=Bacillus sp. FJAT-50079 TaxID=2833577 RepID=UPI001BC8EB71|nr:VWA domain-containing protein [Bacillus sp. FJAT-50079]MBS4207056.1 VWA domain-containing protein [Bacillus sp. FJAT-50079]
MRKWLVLPIILLLIGGCAEKVEKDRQEETDEAVVAYEVIEDEGEVTDATGDNRKSETATGSIAFNEIEELTIPGSTEELIAQPPGIFTKDIPYEKETKKMWGDFGLGDYEEELKEKLREVTATTQDPVTLFQSLHYFIGSNAYGRAAKDLNEYSVEWYEPYLPEPEEMEEGVNSVDPGKALILLDASSSMLLNVEGKQKMAVAKSAAGRFANTIGATHDVSLIVYGHAGTQNDADKELSCTTIDEIFPLQPFDAEKFTQAVDGVEAKGWTPIANAIKTAREKMAGSSENVTLYIISDGAETCDGDPVAEAKAFAGENEGRTVNIIGFDVDQAGENSLKEVAAAGNGEYISAKTIDELNHSIKKTWVPSFQEIMSKNNSLLKHWGQSTQSMYDQTGLADKFYYSGLNEQSRFVSALNLMRGEEMITSEIYNEVMKLIVEKQKLTLAVMKELDEKKSEEVEADRQQVIERVREWTERMNRLQGAGN